MKRVIEAFHVKRGSERSIGFLQVILVVLVVAGTIGVTRLIRSGGASGPGVSQSLEQVVVDIVTPREVAHTLKRTLTGEVEARASVTITPQVYGRVTTIHPRLAPGMTVNASDILFEIDPLDFELALEQAEAQVAAAEAELLQTEATAGNYIKDWKRVFPNEPAPALVAKEPQVKALEAKLRSAKAIVSQAKLNLSRTKYSLGYDARITDSRVEKGQLLNANGQYGSLYALDGLRVRASITPEDLTLLQLSPGKTVTLSSDMIGAGPTDTAISSIGGALSDKTRLQPIFAAVPEGMDIVPGAFVQIDVETAVSGTLYQLPQTALATSTTVWTVQSGRLRQTDVQVIDVAGDYIFTMPFDAHDGVVTTEVPTSFVNRPVTVRNHNGRNRDGAPS